MIVGLAWYRREDYRRILDLMEDADDLPNSYKNWLRLAEKTERILNEQGLMTVRTLLEPEAFLDFCAEKGLKPIASTRSAYASEQAATMTASHGDDGLDAITRFLFPRR